MKTDELAKRILLPREAYTAAVKVEISREEYVRERELFIRISRAFWSVGKEKKNAIPGRLPFTCAFRRRHMINIRKKASRTRYLTRLFMTLRSGAENVTANMESMDWKSCGGWGSL